MADTATLIERLTAKERNRTGGHPYRVDVLFGDQPDVLDAIRVAHHELGKSTNLIAEHLSEFGEPISAAAVASWLRAQRGTG